MLAWRIFSHSVRMVFGNYRQVLKFVVGPAVVGIALIVGISLVTNMASGLSGGAFSESEVESPMAFILFILISVALTSGVTFWIAIAWHRFILLEEYSKSLFPEFRIDRILSYLGRGLQLTLLIVAMMIPVLFLTSASTQIGFSAGVAIQFLAIVLIASVVLRMGIIFPAVAIGKPLGLQEAWNATSGMSATLIVLLLIVTAFQIGIQLIVGLVGYLPFFGIIASVLVGSILLPLINLSVLTTMYGVFVERRDLN